MRELCGAFSLSGRNEPLNFGSLEKVQSRLKRRSRSSCHLGKHYLRAKTYTYDVVLTLQ